jgi:hypothetical protein
MSLAVNAVYDVAGYYASPTFTDVALGMGCASRPVSECYYQITKRPLNCNGNLLDYFYLCSPGHSGGYCTVEEYWAWGETGCAIERGACWLSVCPDGCEPGLHDTRTSSQLSSGCCPANTIPCLAEIEDFKASVISHAITLEKSGIFTR